MEFEEQFNYLDSLNQVEEVKVKDCCIMDDFLQISQCLDVKY